MPGDFYHSPCNFVTCTIHSSLVFIVSHCMHDTAFDLLGPMASRVSEKTFCIYLNQDIIILSISDYLPQSIYLRMFIEGL
jgi:hypothetical protein